MSKIYPILQVAVPTPLRRLFDYRLPEGEWPAEALQPGVRVRIPFGRRELTGILIRTVTESALPAHKLKPALDLPDTHPVLPPTLLTLGERIADYYHHPVGEALMTLLPVALRRGDPIEIPASPPPCTLKTESALSLNPAQQAALQVIQSRTKGFGVFLLEGVTGSGKTEVYLQAIETALANDQQVLVLLPEIGLTPQTLQRFLARFSVPIVVMHSRMPQKKRLAHWLHARGGNARIIIGTRSAVFTPLANPGLIIIDEEHDLSYKQQDSFRYHARDVAILRAQAEDIPIVLGSATPALESLLNARKGRYHHLILPERAGNALAPTFRLENIRNVSLDQGLSPTLLSEAKQHLEAGNQVMLFLNRRGFAPTLLCRACGWIATCRRCDKRMTWHRSAGQLLCHHCDRNARVPARCEQCGNGPLEAAGQGTERLEENITALFPEFPVIRIDRDSTRRKGAMETALNRIREGKARLLTGTQMLAKGHHFPDVTLVAIVDADGGFFSADFRGPERMGQLVLQVAGRSGRAEKPGSVIIQTHHPDHPLFHLLTEQGYSAFATALLEERQLSGLPPYSFLALFRAEAHEPAAAMAFLAEVSQCIPLPKGVSLMGPITAPLAKRAGRYRYQLLLQSAQRSALQDTLKTLLPQVETMRTGRKVRWSVDVDPLEMC